MKEIKMYQSEDGEIFKTIKECGEHEFKIHAIKVIMGELNDRPTTLDFDYGKVFVQQDLDTIKKAITRIAQLSMVDLPDDFYLNPMAHRDSMTGIVICGSDRLLAKSWHRFQCMDYDCREWGQPYFANRSDTQKRKQEEIIVDKYSDTHGLIGGVKKEDCLLNECCGVFPDLALNKDTNLYVLKCKFCGALKTGPTKIDTILAWNKAQEK